MPNPQLITVRKLDAEGKQVFTYSGTVLKRDKNCVQLEARFGHDTIDVDYVVLERGDRFVEWHYADRWYNVFKIHSKHDDRLKGWYCNVTRPASIDADLIEAVDLALDLWVAVDGSMLVLDEDEFGALNLSEADQQAALAAMHDLKALVRGRQIPFDELGEG